MAQGESSAGGRGGERTPTRKPDYESELASSPSKWLRHCAGPLPRGSLSVDLPGFSPGYPPLTSDLPACQVAPAMSLLLSTRTTPAALTSTERGTASRKRRVKNLTGLHRRRSFSPPHARTRAGAGAPHSFISLAGEAAHMTTRGHHRSGDVTRAMSARRAKPRRERSEDQTRPSLRGGFAKRSGDTDGSLPMCL